MRVLYKNPIIMLLAVFFVLIAFGKPITSHAAATVPALGTTANFSVLGGSTITNTGSTVISKDLGLSPGTSATGFTFSVIPGPGIVNGITHIADGAAIQAQTDATTAYNGLSQSCDFGPFGPTDLAGATLVPGVYCYSSSVQISSGGVLHLDALGDPNAVWIFRSVSTLTTVSGASVVFVGGVGSACNVLWQVGSSATLGTTTAFVGTIIAADDITLNTGATVNGRVFARGVSADGALTLDTNAISGPTCTASATLTVTKTVNNNYGGTKAIADFPLFIDGQSVTSGVASTTSTGLHTVSETSDSGYTSVIGGACASGGTITLTAGQTATCTITNSDIAPQLTVTKTVVNTGGGTKVYTEFPLFIDGQSVTSGVASTTTSGLHTVSETSTSSYTSLIGGACAANGGITLLPGDIKTCTISNTYIPPGSATLTVTKTVNNNHGGSKIVADFPLFIDGQSVTSGVASTTSTGLHTVSETPDPGYASTIGGNCAANGTITLLAGEVKTCTIINNDIAPQLVVTKIIVGGSKVIADFPLFIDGQSVTSGVASTTAAGLHTISETSASSYTGVIGGNCASDGTITLAPGDLKTCTITNTYTAPASGGGGGGSGGGYVSSVPPLIDVVKVPSPLALPAGPGPVTYTYTLRNIGTVPVANVTMVGDTCAPITLVSGDTNNDAKLDVNETWVYRCTMTLSATHINTVTATGWANGITAVDIASATVIVGLPVVPPLIHVTKIPKPLALPAYGGTIIYTETVTNPGAAALNNVSLTDDKCGPMEYVSGDTNGNLKLETTETWVYTCRAKLIKTTTNTAIASGQANGLAATDFAIAIVVVSATVPGFPNTGLPLKDKTIPWNTTVLSGIFAVSFLIYIIRKKQNV